jgi:hypothetical protein
MDIPGIHVSIPGKRSNLKGGFHYRKPDLNRKDTFGNNIGKKGSQKITFNDTVRIIPIKSR